MPLFLYNKHISIIIFSLGLLFILVLKIRKNRFDYKKGNKINFRNLLFIWLFIFISIKYLNYQYFKESITMYIHLDKWAFNLLEWKIEMYEKTNEKDLYTENVGLKPIWVGDKVNKKDVAIYKLWDSLYKKPKKLLIDDLELKLKKKKYHYYLYFKYHKKTLFVKTFKAIKKVEMLEKAMSSNDKKKLNYINKTNVKEYTPLIDTTNENPVVTEEKERERLLHQTILFNNFFTFSLNNYYNLNLLLRDLTFDQLYNQPFIDKKSIENNALNEKRGPLLLNIKEKITVKEEIKLYKKVIHKIKENKKIFNNNINKIKKYSFNKQDYYYVDKLLSYIIIKKNEDQILKGILKKFNIKKFESEKKKKKQYYKYF